MMSSPHSTRPLMLEDLQQTLWFAVCKHMGVQEEYVDGVEKHDLETQATIERERITTAAVKQLKAEIKEEKSKHEEEVPTACCCTCYYGCMPCCPKSTVSIVHIDLHKCVLPVATVHI